MSSSTARWRLFLWCLAALLGNACGGRSLLTGGEGATGGSAGVAATGGAGGVAAQGGSDGFGGSLGGFGGKSIGGSAGCGGSAGVAGNAGMAGGAGFAGGPGCSDPSLPCPDDATLASLEVTPGSISPEFAPTSTMYALTVPRNTNQVTVDARASDPRAFLTINGQAVMGPLVVQLANAGPTRIQVVVTAPSGAQMTYTLLVLRQELRQVAYLKASNTGSFDQFGRSLALFGDTLAVGAPDEGSAATGVDGDQTDDSAPNAGAVYVFVRKSGTWIQQAYLKASNTGAGDSFGVSVSLSGNRLAVGAPSEDGAATGVNGDQADDTADRAGAAYVFVRDGTTWTQEAYLKASNTHAHDFFGASVSLSGDTLAVGAYLEGTGANGDPKAPESGATYIFVRSNGEWTQQAYLKASNAGSYDGFGINVSLSGDGLAVGAPSEDGAATGVDGTPDDAGPNAGAVYVFGRSAGTWTERAYLKASNTDVNDFFGASLSLSGDTLAVGARVENSAATGVDGSQDDETAPDAGAVYVFARSEGSWTQQAYLKASNTETSDHFGSDLALSGDTLAVAARSEDSNASGVDGDQSDNSASDAGAVYVFARTGSTWIQTAYLKASNPQAEDLFGSSLFLSGGTLAVWDYSEDSAATGIDGNQNDESAPSSGAVYLFEGVSF